MKEKESKFKVKVRRLYSLMDRLDEEIIDIVAEDLGIEDTAFRVMVRENTKDWPYCIIVASLKRGRFNRLLKRLERIYLGKGALVALT